MPVSTLSMAANALGLLGIVVCLVTGVARALGFPYLAGFESITLFIGGIALICMGCFVKLHVLEKR